MGRVGFAALLWGMDFLQKKISLSVLGLALVTGLLWSGTSPPKPSLSLSRSVHPLPSRSSPLQNPKTPAPAHQRSLRIEPTEKFPETRESFYPRIADAEVAHRETLVKLSSEFEKLSPERRDRFLEGLVRVSQNRSLRGEFLAEWEGSLAEVAGAYFNALFELQDHYLALDGMKREELIQHVALASPKLEKRAEEVRKASLSREAESFIQKVSGEVSVGEEELRELFRVCGGERSCIEKGVLAWMDANHVFHSSQLAWMDQQMGEER